MRDRDPENWMDREREEARDARNRDVMSDDRPTRGEVDRDESPGPYRTDEDPYRGVCGGCHQPVSAFAGHRGGHEGACLWTDGPWHPSCRANDAGYIARLQATAHA